MRFEKRLQIGRIKIKFSCLGRDAFMGRFGGGWQWKVGFQAGGRCLLISLLVAELRLEYEGDA